MLGPDVALTVTDMQEEIEALQDECNQLHALLIGVLLAAHSGCYVLEPMDIPGFGVYDLQVRVNDAGKLEISVGWSEAVRQRLM